MSIPLRPVSKAPAPGYPSTSCARERGGRSVRRAVAAAGASVLLSLASVASAERVALPGGPPPPEWEIRLAGEPVAPAPPPPIKPLPPPFVYIPPPVFAPPPPPPVPPLVVPLPAPPPDPQPVRLPGRRAPIRMPGVPPSSR